MSIELLQLADTENKGYLLTLEPEGIHGVEHKT